MTALQLKLEQILKEFQALKLQPQIGAELEFYLQSTDQKAVVKTVAELSKKHQVDKEKGLNQYECVVSYTADIRALIEQLNKLRADIGSIANACGVVANFAAKPIANDYGSALHLHLSLHDELGENVFSSDSYNDNRPLQNAIAGILALAAESIYPLCPNEHDYSRFAPNFMAPTTISWGGNNRTTIIRIPDSKPPFRRIEYRLPPASADPSLAVQILLRSVHHGLKNHLNPPDRTYGLAHDTQYQLPQLPSNLAEAQAIFENGKVLREVLFKY